MCINLQQNETITEKIADERNIIKLRTTFLKGSKKFDLIGALTIKKHFFFNKVKIYFSFIRFSICLHKDIFLFVFSIENYYLVKKKFFSHFLVTKSYSYKKNIFFITLASK